MKIIYESESGDEREQLRLDMPLDEAKQLVESAITAVMNVPPERLVALGTAFVSALAKKKNEPSEPEKEMPEPVFDLLSENIALRDQLEALKKEINTIRSAPLQEVHLVDKHPPRIVNVCLKHPTIELATPGSVCPECARIRIHRLVKLAESEQKKKVADINRVLAHSERTAKSKPLTKKQKAWQKKFKALSKNGELRKMRDAKANGVKK